jgi:hypothetical protein
MVQAAERAARSCVRDDQRRTLLRGADGDLHVLYVWFAFRHSRREIVHWSVTESPTAL